MKMKENATEKEKSDLWNEKMREMGFELVSFEEVAEDEI